MDLEKKCELICRGLEQKYQSEFNQHNQQLVIEFMRTLNGQTVTNQNLLDINYESSIEIGVEQDDEYYPNTTIPIWKCKSEWFQKIGYLTRRDANQLEEMISSIVMEMLDDEEGE
jgi:hypothetical protein